MSDKVIVCPNCGFHVWASDDICPRCDYPLKDAAPQHTGWTGFNLPSMQPDSDPLPRPPQAPEDRSEVPTTAIPPAPAPPDAAPDSDEPPFAVPQAPPPPAIEPDDPAPVLLTPEELDEWNMPAPEPEDAAPVVLPDEPAAAPPRLEVELAAPQPAEIAPPEIPAVPEIDAAAEAEPESEPTPEAVEITLPRVNVEPPRRRGPAAAAPAEDIPPEEIAPPSEMVTSRWEAPPSPAVEDDSPAATQIGPRPAREDRAAYRVPPAPYTPPPAPAAVAPPSPAALVPPQPAYAAPAYAPAPSPAWNALQQRAQDYLRGGYELRGSTPREVWLARGKSLGAGAWIVALLSVIGVLWYWLILLFSGFRKDVATLSLEPDGRIYEDGSGAAHVRLARARAGRRWSLFGLALFVLSLVLAVILAAVAGVAVSQKRYQAALREAYPAVTLFEERFTNDQADPGDVDLVRDGAVVWSILAGIAVVGLWGGLTLLIIGYIQASAYRVHVPPLPGYA